MQGIIKAVCVSEAKGTEKRPMASAHLTVQHGIDAESGDEFGAFAVGIVSREMGEAIVRRLFDRLAALNIPELNGQRISVSAGAVLDPERKHQSFHELYALADDAMYSSKKTAGNGLTFYADKYNSIETRQSLRPELPHAALASLTIYLHLLKGPQSMCISHFLNGISLLPVIITCHRCLYPRHLRPCEGSDEDGEQQPHGGTHPKSVGRERVKPHFSSWLG